MKKRASKLAEAKPAGVRERESDEKSKHIWMSAAHKGEWVLFSRFVKCQMRFLNKTRAFFALRMPPNLKWIPIHLSSELCSWASNVYANALHSHCELWSMRHLHTHITLSPTHFWQNAHTGPNELCRNNLTSSGDIISVAFHLQSASRRSSRWMKNALIIIRHYECVCVCRTTLRHYLYSWCWDLVSKNE